MPSIAKKVNSLTIVNVGKLYTEVPDVVLSPPDIDSDIVLSLILNEDNLIQSISIVDSGGYYKEDPTISFSYKTAPPNYIGDGKFGDVSYKITSDDADKSYSTTSSASGNGGFFVKCPIDVTLDQSIIRFVDSDATNAQLSFRIGSTGNAEFLLGSTTLDTAINIADDSWHWVWFEVVNNILYASIDSSSPVSVTDSKTVSLLGSQITILNNTNSGARIDDIHLNSNTDSAVQPTFAIPVEQQDSNETTLFLETFETFQKISGTENLTVTTDAKFRLTSVSTPVLDTYLDSSSFIISSPTGTKAEFTAKAYAVWDSSSGTVTSLVLTDSGDYYSSSPIVTISAPLGVDYPKNLTVTQTNDDYIMSGEVVKYVDSSGELFLTHIGANDGLYHTFQTNVNITGSNNGAIRKVLSISELTEEQEQAGTVQSQNYDFDTVGDSFLDFTESNPFGDPQ